MNQYETETTFYDEVLDTFGAKYPRLFEDNIGMVKVLHVFDNKLPMIDVLLRRNLLTGLVLKKSSSDMQAETVSRLKTMAGEREIRLQRSETTYARALPELSRVSAGRPFVLGDHGGYYTHLLADMSRKFGRDFVGATEHTLNGDKRHTQLVNIPMMSTARLDLKERSDRTIAESIASEIQKMVYEASGVDILSPHQHARVLMVGYGLMGMHASRHLKDMGCQSELIVTDISAKKMAYAVQDDFTVATDLKEILPSCDVVILATDVIMGQKPVLDVADFALLKADACITSMTSMDDEVRQYDRIADGTITPIGREGAARIYKGPSGQTIRFLLDGRPANVALSHGGSGEAIHMVEAAGLAGAFAVAQSERRDGAVQGLSDEDSEIISSLWLHHFHGVDTPPRLVA